MGVKENKMEDFIEKLAEWTLIGVTALCFATALLMIVW